MLLQLTDIEIKDDIGIKNGILRIWSRTVALRAPSAGTRSSTRRSTAPTMRALLTASTPSPAGTCAWPTQARTEENSQV